MKSFWVPNKMGHSDILDSELDGEELEAWLQGKLEHATSARLEDRLKF